MRVVRRRLVSWWWDYLAILGWLVALAVVFGGATAAGWIDLAPLMMRPVAGDLFVTLVTVLPWLVYLVVTEAGPAHATWGKRRGRLAVRAAAGGRAVTGRILVRNIVKVVPWQLGHMAVMRFATGPPSAFAVVCYVASLALLALVAGPPLARRRGVHDRLAGTTVVSADPAV